MKTLNTMLGAALLMTAAAAAAEPTVRPLALDAADLYRAQARFPNSSQPIRDALDPLLAKRTPSKQTLAGPNGEGPVLSVWNSAISYEPKQAVDLYAELTDGPPKAPSLLNLLDKNTRSGASSITAKLIGEDSGALGDVTYRDDGKGADSRAGDGIYSARFVLPAGRAPALGHAESVAVQVQAVTAKGEYRGAVGGLLYSNPGARLTGHYKDLMRDGSMIIAAEVEVLTPGRYHLAGTLANALGQPMAYAQNADAMQAGKQWLELSYYGLIFRDLAATGPYTLTSVTLTSALGMPNAMTPVQRNVHRTQAHALVEFVNRPFNEPALLDAAQRLERAAQ